MVVFAPPADVPDPALPPLPPLQAENERTITDARRAEMICFFIISFLSSEYILLETFLCCLAYHESPSYIMALFIQNVTIFT